MNELEEVNMFERSKDKNITDWYFEALNPMDYKYHMFSRVNNRILSLMLKKVKKILAKNKIAHTDPTSPDLLVCPPEHISKFSRQILVSCHSQINEMKHIIGLDGIKLLNESVLKFYFLKYGGFWEVHFEVRGQYVKDKKNVMNGR